MRTIIAVYRLAGFLGLMAAFYFTWLLGLPAVIFSREYSWRWRCLIFRHWARATAFVMGIEISLKGAVPAGPAYLVANHLSYIDVITLAAHFDSQFIAKSEVAGWPLLGFLSRRMGTIFIDRRRRRDILRVNAQIEESLREGRSVVLFPEGTTTSGAEVCSFKSSLLEPAVKLGHPVFFATLNYRTHEDDQPAANSVCWWGDMDFMPHLWRMFMLKEIKARVQFGEDSVTERDRKVLARSLQDAVEREFVPVRYDRINENMEEQWLTQKEDLNRKLAGLQ
jgi:1-acyl-sn-glycerol-3-phosphate acyltransferase